MIGKQTIEAAAEARREQRVEARRSWFLFLGLVVLVVGAFVLAQLVLGDDVDEPVASGWEVAADAVQLTFVYLMARLLVRVVGR